MDKFGTLETYNEVVHMIHKESEYKDLTTIDLRTLEIVDLLKELGIFVWKNHEGQGIQFNFRGHEYFLDQVDCRFISFYMDIGNTNLLGNREQIEILEEVIHEMNAEEFLVNIYLRDSYIVIGSSQYLGNREAICDEVEFMIKNMDQVARRFWEKIGKDEALIYGIRCI